MDAAGRQRFALYPVQVAQVAAPIVEDGGRAMRRIAVTLPPLEQPMIVGRAAAKIPTVHLVVEPAPERDLLECDGGDRRVVAEHGEDLRHLFGAIELVYV